MRTYLEPTPDEAVAEMSRRVSRVPGRPPGFSSIVQDLAAGRRTEIEETFGDLVRRGHARGLPVPRSELVYRIVGGISAGCRRTGSTRARHRGGAHLTARTRLKAAAGSR